MAKSGMNPKVLQYLMGHSDISVTLNTYTHLKLDDAIEEVEKLARMQAEANEEFRHMGLKDDIPTKNGGRIFCPVNMQTILRTNTEKG